MKKKTRKPRARKATAKVLAKESRILGARFVEIMSRVDMPGCVCPWCSAAHPHPHFPTCLAAAFVEVSTQG